LGVKKIVKNGYDLIFRMFSIPNPNPKHNLALREKFTTANVPILTLTTTLTQTLTLSLKY